MNIKRDTAPYAEELTVSASDSALTTATAQEQCEDCSAQRATVTFLDTCGISRKLLNVALNISGSRRLYQC